MHNKTEWLVKNDRVQINMPFAKVDKERRLVSGFATLDNVDKHGDVITADASKKAFSAWRGNLREMHAPIAVGKVVEFREEEFFDPIEQKTYKGIFVDAYVSKGAQDTWEKVLDGTLTGFSIGGRIIKRSVHVDEEYEVEYRQIDEYELVELSLVDSPANQLANVVSIQKSDTGPLFSGFAVETKTQNVMYCGDCATAVITLKDDFKCDAHGEMANIGWVEDTENKADAVKSLVMRFRKDSFQKSIDELIASGEKVDMSKFDSYLEPRVTVVKHQEGGAEMAENNDNNKNVETGHSDTDRAADVDQGQRRVETDNAPAGTPTEIADAGGVEEFTEAKQEAKEEANSDDDEEGTTKAASVSEVDTSDGVDLDRLTKAITDKVVEVVKSVKAESDEAVASAKTSFEDALAEMRKEIVAELSGKIDNLGSRVSNLEDGTAVKKSVDVANDNDDEDEENESLWRGTFLSASDFVS